MKYDVVVVGAGPAGSTAAKFLSEKGVKVLLIDKNKFPRDKPCAGGISTKTLKRFKYIQDDWIESYSYATYTHSSSLKYKFELQRDEPLIAMILRKKFDYELVKLAISSGTTFLDAKSAEDIKILDNKVKIILKNGANIESEIVIGADGVWSTIAKKSGLRNNTKNICICLFEEYPMNSKTIEQFLDKKRICHIHLNVNKITGYGWVFPKKEHVNIGITQFQQALDSSKGRTNLKNTYETYIKILKENKIIPENLKIGKIRGAALPTCPFEKTYSDRLVLCGDAAGFANPLSGEGIYYAMSSGKIAADVVTEALEEENTNNKFLSRYQTIWYRDFGRDLKSLYNISMIWGKDNEKLFRIISKDKKLSELAVEVIIGQIDVQKCIGKIKRRVAYLIVKDKLV